MSSLSVAAAVLPGLTAQVWADGQLAVQFAFARAKPDRARYALVGAALAAKLKPPRFHCKKTQTGSGSRAILCSSEVKGASDYMILGSLDACEAERKDETAAD